MTTETDRELLEWAAKAAGQERSAGGDLWSNARGLPWNPLTDDGDALRLSVACRIDIHQDPLQVSCDSRNHGHVWETHNGIDPYAATRRAIVRAAAAIGKEMKECT